MKKFTLTLFAAVFALNANAQKLQDIIDKHDAQLATKGAASVGKEAKDAHYQRWLWYAKQHTDMNGNLVSEQQKYDKLKAYTEHRARMKTTAPSLADWKPLGADTIDQSWISKGFGLGRVNIIEFHPTNANTYFVGATNGGVWKTTDDGKTWTSLTDQLPVLSVSDIDVNPSNDNSIFLCPGDRDGADDTWNHYSPGLMKSTDGGQSWSSIGPKHAISDQILTNSLLINPSDTNSLTLAMQDGVYKSTDGGQNWTQTLTGPHVKQLLYHPTDTSIIYAASYATQNGLAQIYRSVDGGQKWFQVTSFDFNTNDPAYRVALAVSKANTAMVMAVVVDLTNANESGLLGIYRSNNSGASFTQIYTPGTNCSGNLLSSDADGTKCGGQGFYDVCIAVSPTNADEVYVGGVNAFYSTDGGTSWNPLNQWDQTLPGVSVVHADKHWMMFHPLKPARLYDCNDGGVAYTDVAAASNSTWVDITNGMEITQFYRIAVANSSNQFVMGGAQDNSVFIVDEDNDIDFIGTGDGTNVQIDMKDTVVYGAEQYGVITRRDYKNQTEDEISDNILPGGGKPNGPWVTSFIINPHNNNHLVAGYGNIFYSTDKGDTWNSVTNAPLENGKFVSRVEMTPASASTIYATVDGSNDVHYTHNFTVGSTATFSTLTIPNGGKITDIEVDNKDKDHFWLTLGGYGSDQVLEYKNSAFTKMNAGLPDVPVLCFRQDTANRTIYVGTDYGVFFREPTDTQWRAYDKGLPKVNVSDLEINYVTKQIFAGTYGRGVWVSPKQDTPVSVTTIPYADDVFVVAPNPNNGQFNITIKGKNIANEGELTVSVLDYTGKVIAAQTKVASAGRMNVSLPDVPSGVYIVELKGQKAVIGRKRVAVR